MDWCYQDNKCDLMLIRNTFRPLLNIKIAFSMVIEKIKGTLIKKWPTFSLRKCCDGGRLLGGLARPEVIALSLFVEMISKEFSEDEGLRVSGDFVSRNRKLIRIH